MVEVRCECWRERGYYDVYDNDEYVGRCIVERMRRNGEPVYLIYNVRVLTECRRRGYATMMLQKVINDFVNRGKVILEVYQDNEIAIHLYKKLGFQMTEEYMHDGKPAWIMQLMTM